MDEWDDYTYWYPEPIGAIAPGSDDPYFQPGAWPGPNMNDDYVSDGSTGAFPLQPGQSGSSTGFWNSLANALGGAFGSIANTAINEGTNAFNTGLTGQPPPSQVAAANAAAAQRQRQTLITIALIGGLVIAGLVAYRMSK